MADSNSIFTSLSLSSSFEFVFASSFCICSADGDEHEGGQKSDSSTEVLEEFEVFAGLSKLAKLAEFSNAPKSANPGLKSAFSWSSLIQKLNNYLFTFFIR